MRFFLLDRTMTTNTLGGEVGRIGWEGDGRWEGRVEWEG